MIFDPLKIPGFVEAVVQERLARDVAFLGLSEDIAGFEVRPLSLRHYLVLRLANSPLLTGQTPAPAELAQFLWLVSVDYCRNARARARFLKRCRRFVPPAAPWFETRRWRRRFNMALLEMAIVLKAARNYVQEAMMDGPAASGPRGYRPEYYSQVAFWLALFDYHYTPEQVLEMPMKVLYQTLNERAEHNSPKKPLLFNPSERVIAGWLEEQNRADKSGAPEPDGRNGAEAN